jgi:putative ABC transport system permease protein
MQFADLKTNVITLIAEPDYGNGIPADNGWLTEADLRAITTLPNVRTVISEYHQSVELRNGLNNTYSYVSGVSPNYLGTTDPPPILGRFIREQDVADRARVIVLSWSVAQMVFPDGQPIGRELLVENLSFQVIGVLSAKQDSAFGIEAYLPISTMRDRVAPTLPGSRIEVSQATITVEDIQRLDATQAAIDTLLRARHRIRPEYNSDFRFQSYREFADSNNNILAGITAFLGLIGGISLAVGGIGIMNIMLVSVTERTQEIGLRKAVGARSRDILAQFLVESVVLSLIGGLSGLLITLILVHGGAILIHTFAADSGFAPFLLLDASAVILSLGFASLVGLLAGIYPALRAARLAPIVALRTN